MKKSYFEDFEIGDEFITPGRTVTEADVVLFAGLTGDYNRIHTDAELTELSSSVTLLENDAVLPTEKRAEDRTPPVFEAPDIDPPIVGVDTSTDSTRP